MNKNILTIISSLFCMNLFAQSDNMTYYYFFKVDSTYVMVDNSKGHGFTLEFKADTLFRHEDNMIVYDNRKLLQIKVNPFSEILPNQKKSISIPKALQAYKKWELNYQQKMLMTKLKSGEEFYYRDKKPFLIWWQKNPPANENDYNEKEYEYDPETKSLVEVKSLKVTHMLCLNFSIYAEKNVAFTIPIFEDENLKEEIEKLKKVANSVRVFGSGILDIDVLMNTKESKEKYVLRDSLNFLELEVPDWLNVFKPIYDNMFWGTFPEWHEVVNAMSMVWEYKSDSLSFNDFVNRSKLPHKDKANYRLIEESNSTLKYFCTSDNGWFYQQNVYLKGDNIYCFINFTATKNTYDYNIGRFEEIIKKIKLK